MFEWSHIGQGVFTLDTYVLGFTLFQICYQFLSLNHNYIVLWYLSCEQSKNAKSHFRDGVDLPGYVLN